MVCEEGVSQTGPPSRKSPKKRGDTPIPPSFGVDRESPGPRDEVGLYRAGEGPVHVTANGSVNCRCTFTI